MILLLGLAGCQSDEISQYRVAHVEEPTAPPDKVRLVGIILPKGDDAWFFKLVGPIDPVGAARPAFDAFLQSIQFPDGGPKPITWTPPDGWKEVEGPKERFATLHSDELKLDITVSKLPVKAADELANINRWRRVDLGLGPIGPVILPDYTKKVKVAGLDATLTDMTGPGVDKSKQDNGMGGPMLANDRPLAPPERKQLTYKTPEGWKDLGPSGGFVPMAARFSLSGKEKPEVTVISLPLAGGLKANLDRWRGQVRLLPLTDKEFADLRPPVVTVDDAKGQLFDLTGPAGPGQERMVIVLVERKGQAWYFKLLGPTELVEKNKTKFDAFVASVKFTGAAE
jgi:hypothetical protein